MSSHIKSISSICAMFFYLFYERRYLFESQEFDCQAVLSYSPLSQINQRRIFERFCFIAKSINLLLTWSDKALFLLLVVAISSVVFLDNFVMPSETTQISFCIVLQLFHILSISVRCLYPSSFSLKLLMP